MKKLSTVNKLFIASIFGILFGVFLAGYMPFFDNCSQFEYGLKVMSIFLVAISFVMFIFCGIESLVNGE